MNYSVSSLSGHLIRIYQKCSESYSVVSELFATSWTAACQAPLSMGILQARILGWVGSHALPCPEDLPNPGIKPWSPSLQADSSLSEPLGKHKYVRRIKSKGILGKDTPYKCGYSHKFKVLTRITIFISTHLQSNSHISYCLFKVFSS